MEKVILGTMGIHEAKNLQDELMKNNISLFLDHNDMTCTRGCAVTVELSCFEKDIQQVFDLINNKYMQSLEGLNINLEQMNQVFDPNQETATCPACGHKFSTNSNECPDCGLCF